jgi:hypothetical protein
MSSSLLHIRFAVFVALLASYFPIHNCLAADPAPAAQPKSSAKTDSSSGSGLDFKRSTLSDLMHGFPSKPEFGNFGSQNSAPAPAPPRAPAPSRRTQQLWDDQKNWVFLTPGDVLNDYLVKEHLKAPEFDSLGREKSSVPAVERFYERLSDDRSSANSASGSFSFNTDNDANPILSGISSELKNPASSANTLSTVLDNFNSMVMRPGGVADLSNAKNDELTPQEFREHNAQQRHLEAFSQALNYQSFQSQSLMPTTTPSTPASQILSAWNNSSDAAQVRNPYDPSTGIYNPLLSLAAPKAPVAPAKPMAPTRPNIYDKPTTITTIPRLTPAGSDFSVPKRNF